jgi:oxygen-independent coproporphyrinogen-3 oxidase
MIGTTGSAESMREDIDIASEYVFLGLRQEKGIDLGDYTRRFGKDLASEFAADLGRLLDADLIELTTGNLRLSGRGKLFSNEVFAVFV